MLKKKCRDNVRGHRNEQQSTLSVYFQNGSGYDFSLIFNNLLKENKDKKKVSVLPNANGKVKSLLLVV